MSFGQWASDYLGVPLEERFNFNPLTYFLYSGIDGAWFDPEDMSTMFQDAAGTIPVTALEQPVGRWLDKSGNGNHATQSITASRPTLSARYNLLTKTENFADAVWLLNTLTITSNSILSPFGDLSADTVTKTAGPSGIFQIIPVTPSSVYTFSCYVKSGSFNISNHRFAFYNETAQSFIASDVIPTYVNSNDGWFLGIATVNIPAGCTSLRVYPFRSTLSLAGSFYLFGAQLNTGTAPLPYQRVNTATDYDTNPALFPKYLKFDGIDDFLNLPYMGLYANGSASVVAALSNSSSDAEIVAEANNADIVPFYRPIKQLSAGSKGPTYRNNAAELTAPTALTSPANLSIRIVSCIDDGISFKLRDVVNGQSANVLYTRGVTTLTNTTIGALVRTTTSSYHNGPMYGLIITKSALSDTDRRRCEQFLARRLSTLGVTLS